MPALYQLSYLALYWRSPYFVNIFVQGGGGVGRQSEVKFNNVKLMVIFMLCIAPF